MTRWFRFVVPLAAGAALALALLLFSGVRLGDALRFAAYETGWVWLPGWLVILAARARPGSLLRQIALGAGVGYVLESLAFSLTAALDLRPAFAAYPAAVLIVTLPVIRWRVRRGEIALRLPLADRWAWGLVAVYGLVLALLGIAYFATQPLPGPRTVTYYHDLVWDLGSAAEAQHHWPISDPRVAGEPLPYYTFAFIHLAAISQITGLGLPLVLLRLTILPLVALLAIQLYCLGTLSGGDRRAGLLAVVLALLIGEIDPFPIRRPPYQVPFLGLFFDHLTLSPTFLLGLVCFLPLVMILIETVIARIPPRTGDWAIITLLLVGCGGAKGSILPVVGGGLGLYLAWRVWHHFPQPPAPSPTRSQREFRDQAAALALTVLVAAYFWLFVYGDSGISATLQPFASLRQMDLIHWGGNRLPGGDLIRLIALVPAVIAGFSGLLGVRLVGLGWLLKANRKRLSNAQVFLLALFAASLIPFLFLSVPGKSQLYFFWYGYAALCVLAAQGLIAGWRALRPDSPRRTGAAALVIALLALGAADAPLDHLAVLRNLLSGRPAYSADSAGLTAGLWEGLIWARDHTPANAIFAVNNQTLRSTGDARYFYYSAFAERRVFLEGWAYTRQGRRWLASPGGDPHPFPERAALNQRVFEKGDPAAIHAMAQRYGVTHLLVDKVHGPPAPGFGTAARLIYRSAAVEIYEIAAGEIPVY